MSTVTSDPETTPDTDGAPARGPVRWVSGLLVAVIAVAALLAGGGLAVALGIGRTDDPTVGSVDVGFAQDMSRHHLQAVEMANLAPDRSTDPEVRQLAFDISATQTNQAGRMQGWLALWDVPRNSGDTMAWMSGDGGHDHGLTDDGLMPGMATSEELTTLRELRGDAFDVEFLRLMIRHHQGGFEMAEYAIEHADVPAVRDLAHAISASQSAETGTMATMLAQRGGVPLAAP